MMAARPAFSVDDTGVYFAGIAGITRLQVVPPTPEGAPPTTTVIVPDVVAAGGLAVSPDGARLVYSDCMGRGALIDSGVTPARVLTPVGMVASPGASPDGRVVYVETTPAGPKLMMIELDGQRRQIGGPFDGRVTQPTFSRDGTRIAYVVGGLGLVAQTLSGTSVLPVSPLTNVKSDADPAWLPDGRLLFTRHEGDTIGAHIIDPSGQAPMPLEAVPRRVIGVLANGDILLNSLDSTEFVEWDTKRGRERHSKVSLAAIGRIAGAAMSPSGRWLAVQAGDQAMRVYRFDLSTDKPVPELAFEARRGQTLGNIAISDEGHVLAAPQTWSGELFEVEAEDGTAF
jgi:dipeptidyl aminopeptidase/acylaminoacyl peptidase